MNKREEKLKEVLLGQQREVNADEVWMSISDRLPQKTSRRPVLWLFLLLFIPLGLGAYLLVEKGADNNLAPSEIIESNAFQSIVPSNDNKTNSANKVVEVVNTFKEETEDIGSETSNKETVNRNQAVDEHKATNGSNAVAKIRRKIDVNADPHTADWAAEEKVESNVGRAVTKEEEVIGSKADLASTLLENSEAQTAVDKVAKINSKISQLEKLSLGRKLLIAETRRTPLESMALTSPVNNSAHHLAFVLAAGSNKSIGEVEGIEDYEEGLFGTSINAGIEYNTKKRWSIKLGIAYHTNVSRYLNKEVDYLVGNIEGVDEILIDAQGIQTSNTGTIKEVSIVQNDIRWHRRHKVLDVEMILRKNFQISNRWKAGLDIGIAYNLYTHSKGFGYEVAEGAESIVKFESDPGYFLKRTGLKPILGGELAYKIKGIEILVQGNYQWIIDPINTQTNNYNLKHSQTGIQLGTRYYLNGNKN